MINIHIRNVMIGTKPRSTNAIDCFLQTVTKVVSIFPEIDANF